jgi:RNA polymerase sigma-70 factor (ECF subfamily)
MEPSTASGDAVLSPGVDEVFQPGRSEDVADEQAQVAMDTTNGHDDSHAIVRLAVMGDEAAQRLIYDAHADRIFRLAWRMTGDRAAAEDLTQDVFVRAFDRLRQFRGTARLGTWLYQLGISVILNALRRQRSREAREVPLDPGVKADTGAPGLEPDTRDRVRAAVRQLPEDLRIVVIMYDVEGYQHEDIAELVGISSGASRMRLVRARGMLRSMLALDGSEWDQ